METVFYFICCVCVKNNVRSFLCCCWELKTQRIIYIKNSPYTKWLFCVFGKKYHNNHFCHRRLKLEIFLSFFCLSKHLQYILFFCCLVFSLDHWMIEKRVDFCECFFYVWLLNINSCVVDMLDCKSLLWKLKFL